MSINWREFAEELVRALDDARKEFEDLDVRFFDKDASGKVVELDPLKTTENERWNADLLVESWEAERIVDHLADDWRRKLYSAQIVDDRRPA